MSPPGPATSPSISALNASSVSTSIWVVDSSGAVDAITRPSETRDSRTSELEVPDSSERSSQNPPTMLPTPPSPETSTGIGAVFDETGADPGLRGRQLRWSGDSKPLRKAGSVAS